MLVEGMMSVASKRLVTLAADAPLADAAKLLCGSQIDLLVVCGPDGVMVGVVTKSDVVRQVGHGQGSANTTATAAVMTSEVIYCRPGDMLREVWSTMKERGFLHVPVIDPNFRPSGVINARDALQALMGEVEDEGLLLRDYIMGIGYR